MRGRTGLALLGAACNEAWEADGLQPQSQANSTFTTEVLKLLRHTLNSDMGLWSSPTKLKEVSRQDKL